MNETIKKHEQFLFWENKIMEDHPLFVGNFDNSDLTEKSKIIYTGILDAEKDVFKCGWAVYPNVSSLLGFIQYVFLPTAFFTWFDRSATDFFIPVSTFDIVVEEVLKHSKEKNNLDVEKIQELYNLINTLWNYEEPSINESLRLFTAELNHLFHKEPSKIIFMKIFSSPEDIAPFVRESIGWDCDELAEEEISMDLKTLDFICTNAIREPLLNKKFVDILNSKMSIMF